MGMRSFFKCCLPRWMGTVYFTFFLVTFAVSVTLLNINEEILEMYTSCHGKENYGMAGFYILLVLQCFLSLPRPEGASSRDISLIGQYFSRPKTKSKSNCLSDEELTHSDYISPDGELVSIPSSGIHNDTVIDLDNLYPNKGKKSLKTDEAAKTEKRHISWVDTGKNWKGRFVICWNTLWMIFYNLVIFMAVHSSLLASRVHGSLEFNKYALDTCGHLSGFPLSLGSPFLKYPLINESVFMMTYLSFVMHELIVRKTADAGLIRSFLGSHFFKESKLLGTLRLIVQLAMFSMTFATIARSIPGGFGSPMHVTMGFAMAMLFLWINSSLNTVLQLTQLNIADELILEFNWLWSLLSTANLWICGLLFYISVYGISFFRIYIYVQFLSWLPILTLTYRRGRQVLSNKDLV